MKQITVKITGSGTRKDVAAALRAFAKEIYDFPFDKVVEVKFDNRGITAIVSEGTPEEDFKQAVIKACGKYISDCEIDFYDCYLALRKTCANMQGQYIMAFNVEVTEDEALPVWEGAMSMTAQQMLDCIEDDVKEAGFDPDDFVTP